MPRLYQSCSAIEEEEEEEEECACTGAAIDARQSLAVVSVTRF
jgi:hypothetical protein